MVAPQVVTALSDPRFYPHEPATVELRETHLSLVFLAGPLAYKLKKPVVLDFVDYGNLERRRLMCAEEVRLNRRLAPDVYLGVRALCADGEGLRLAAADDPDAVEYLVEMRRYDESRTLASGSASSAEAAAVGTTLARFHAAAERADGGGPAAVKRTYDDTYETLLALDDGSRAAELVAAERFADAFIVENRALLLTRAARGLVRDGHGDLRAEHVLLEARAVEVVDCVEFDPRLREIDVGADLAFLLMDLEHRGAPQLARDVLAAYRDAGGDAGDDPLLAFHGAQWAWVRAKVALVRAAQAAGGASEADTLIGLARRLRWRARAPLAIVVCGGAATGKSTLARALAADSGFAVVASDAVRKRLAGIAPTDRGPPELYGDAASRRTYAELGRLAAAAADGGVIVDATCRRRTDRALLLDALPPAATVFVECVAPLAVVERRARLREADPRRESDATAAVAARQLAEFEPLDEVSPSVQLTMRSDREPAQLVVDLEAFLDGRAGAAPMSPPGGLPSGHGG